MRGNKIPFPTKGGALDLSFHPRKTRQSAKGTQASAQEGAPQERKRKNKQESQIKKREEGRVFLRTTNEKPTTRVETK